MTYRLIQIPYTLFLNNRFKIIVAVFLGKEPVCIP
jgi:hypothetical protein